MNDRVIITVDGASGTGKTTLSKLLAEKIGFQHLNSGALYRSVAYLCLQEGLDLSDQDAILQMLSRHSIKLALGADGLPVTLVDGNPVDELIRTPEVSEATSKISVLKLVRDYLVPHQRDAFPGCGMVAEGRDMGTVMFPDAQLKFFITVDQDTRIARRLAQLLEKEPNASPERVNELKSQMKIEVADRDSRDSQREIAPLKQAQDALVIDNSAQTLTQTLENMYDAASKRGLVKN
ncbi:MAG: (d)CMP kinase [Deltaproteobacteria bacterium]|nr:(d)CMP kinase [Deltaproteobacteria bacterium]